MRLAAAQAKTPAGVVVHENRGLNSYLEDDAWRVAKAGFIALAPDGLSSVGGYPGNDDKGRELQQQIDQIRLMNDFFAAIECLIQYPRSGGKVGITGFCYGGGALLWTSAASKRCVTHSGAATAALGGAQYPH